MKAIVLCGGLGTRLGELTRETPKPLIHVAGKPFLEYVLDQLLTAPIDEIVLAVSFQWQKIHETIGEQWRGVKVSYSIEQHALGTGGAIKQAMSQNRIVEAIVVNGDTLLKFDADELARLSQENQADIGMALKEMEDCSRYGKVTIDSAHRVVAFEEKGQRSPGLINSGVYYIKELVFSSVSAEVFSFENDILALKLSNLAIYGIPTDAYFIDMGVPEDLSRAQSELAIYQGVADE